MLQQFIMRNKKTSALILAGAAAFAYYKYRRQHHDRGLLEDLLHLVRVALQFDDVTQAAPTDQLASGVCARDPRRRCAPASPDASWRSVDRPRSAHRSPCGQPSRPTATMIFWRSLFSGQDGPRGWVADDPKPVGGVGERLAVGVGVGLGQHDVRVQLVDGLSHQVDVGDDVLCLLVGQLVPRLGLSESEVGVVLGDRDAVRGRVTGDLEVEDRPGGDHDARLRAHARIRGSTLSTRAE